MNKSKWSICFSQVGKNHIEMAWLTFSDLRSRLDRKKPKQLTILGDQPYFSNKILYKIKIKGPNEKLSKPWLRPFIVFYIIKWKFTKGTNNKLFAALFDMSDHDVTLRAPFNRRSWVTRWSKIFKKLRECVFLTEEYYIVISLETKFINHENRPKNRLFFGFSRG